MNQNNEKYCTNCGKPESERWSFHGCTGPCNFQFKEDTNSQVSINSKEDGYIPTQEPMEEPHPAYCQCKKCEPQEPMEWAKEFGKYLYKSSGIVMHEGVPADVWSKEFTLLSEVEQVFEIKQFIQNQIKQAEERAIKDTIELLTKKIINDKGEPICPSCGKNMERDCQEPDGHLWFCPCMKGLRLSIG